MTSATDSASFFFGLRPARLTLNLKLQRKAKDYTNFLMTNNFNDKLQNTIFLHSHKGLKQVNMFKYVCRILSCCSVCSYLWTAWKSPFLLLQFELFLRPLPHFGKEHQQTYSGQSQHKSFYSIFLCNYIRCHEELSERLLKNHNLAELKAECCGSSSVFKFQFI